MLEVMLEVITPEAELTPARASIPLNIHISPQWEQACMIHDSERERKLKIPKTQKEYLVPDQVSVVHVAILFRFVQYDCTSRRISHFSSSLESGALKSKTVCPLKSSNSSETNIFTLSKHLTESISVLHPCSRMCFCRGLLWRTGNASRPRPPPSK